MKRIKSVLAFVFAVSLMCCSLVVPASAEEYFENYEGVYMLSDGTIYDSSEYPDVNLFAGAGTYTFVCDFEITLNDGSVRYIPQEFIDKGYNIMVTKGEPGSYVGGSQDVIASTAEPYIRLEPDEYYKVWAHWGNNTDTIDVFKISPAYSSGEERTVTITSTNMSSGYALGITADYAGAVTWSNYDVLDSNGNVYHANSFSPAVDEPVEPEDPEEPGEAVTVDMTETNEILGVIQSQLWIVLVVGLLYFVYRFFRLFF